MFFANMSTIIILFSIICHVFSFTISIDKRPYVQRPLDIDAEDDIERSLAAANNQKTPNVDEHDIQVKTIRTYLIFGYIILLLIIIYVCYTTYKKSGQYKPMSCSDQ